MNHVGLRVHCMQIKKLEQAKIGIELQVGAINRSAMPSDLIMPAMHASLEILAQRVKELKAGLMGFVDDTRTADWISAYKGLGPSVVYGIGLMPPLSPDWIPDPSEEPLNYMRGVRACWKYAGLDVRDGHAPRRKKGEFSGYNGFLKAVWIYRAAGPAKASPCECGHFIKAKLDKKKGDWLGHSDGGGPCLQCDCTSFLSSSPYGRLFYERRALTLVTHPPMLDVGECEFCDAARRESQIKRADKNQTREREALAGDCAKAGGIHWSDGHRAADASRWVAKQVLKDAWLVANGRLPSVGQQERLEPWRRSPQAAA